MKLPAYGTFRHAAVDMLSSVSFGGSAGFTYPAGLIGQHSAGWSWAGWFQAFVLGSARDLCTSSTANSPGVSYSTTGMLRIRAPGGAFLEATTAIPVKRWVHGAVTVIPLAGGVGFDWAVYLYGEVVAFGREATGTFVTQTAAPVGALGSGARLARQTLWGRGITQAEVRAHYYSGNASTPVADWWVDEGETGQSQNRVASGAALAISVGTGGGWSPDTPKWAPRQVQEFGSILLPGVTGSYLSTAAGAVLPQLVGATGITMIGWARPRFAAGGTNGALMVGRSGSGSGAIHIYHDVRNSAAQGQGRVQFDEASRSSGAIAYVNEPLQGRGRWRMSAVALDTQADLIRIYNQGLQIASVGAAFSGGPFSLDGANPGSNFALGEDINATPGSTIPLDGWLGPQWVYDRTLTNQQIRDVYLKGSCSIEPAFRWLFTERTGTTAASTGKFAAAATLTGSAAWSMEAVG